MQFIYTNGENKDFAFLCQRLDESLNELSGGEENRCEYIELNSIANIHDVIIVYGSDVPIACGSFKKYDDESVEMKRVFVEKAHRGQGIAKAIMDRLEQAAKSKGYKNAVLETGRHMNIAVGMYKSIGYEIIDNYGPYKGMEKSICLGKAL